MKAKLIDSAIVLGPWEAVDFNQFVEAVRQLGLYWLVVNEPSLR